MKLTRINYKITVFRIFLYEKKCLITSKLSHLILQIARLSTKKHLLCHHKICAHKWQSICTSTPKYLHILTRASEKRRGIYIPGRQQADGVRRCARHRPQPQGRQLSVGQMLQPYLLSNDLLRPDCFFILRDNQIKAICDMTDKELRFGHNLEKLYRGGTFGL